MAPRPRKAGARDLPPNLYRKVDSRNGKTYFNYRDPLSGKWYGLGTDKTAAIRKAIAASHAGAKAKPALIERISIMKGKPFADWIEEYRTIYASRGLSPNSVRNTGMRLNRLKERFGQMDMAEIGTFQVAQYLKSIADEGKAQMARAMRSLLNDVMIETVAAGWRSDNPVDMTKAAKVTIKRQRLTLDLWKATYAEAKQPWLRRAMELAILTGQRRDDIASMTFKDVADGHLHVIQAKTGQRLRISTALRLDAVGLDLEAVIRSCRDRVVSQHLVHHIRRVSGAMPGMPIMLDTLSKAFAEARDKGAKKAGINLGKNPPSFHEMRSLAARLHAAEGRDPQMLLGHKSAKMTVLYRDSRGTEWIDVA